MGELVSVIIPTYKGSNSILKSLKSVLNQTYDNIEVFVVDDNGEGTEEQCRTEKILSDNIKDERFHYLKHKVNVNGSAARNTGIRASKGEYLAFLDDDDIWLEDKLKRQIELFETLDYSYGLVYCGGYNVNLQGCGAPKISKFLKGNLLYDFLVGKIDFNSSMFVIRRSVLNEVKEFDESYRRLQDWEFCTRIFSKYNGCGVKEYLVVKYRAERNNAENPEKLLKYYQHYILKIESILDDLGKIKKAKILARFYRRVALEYFKYGDLKKAFQYLGIEENVILGIFKLSVYVCEHGYYRIRYRNKKVI